MCSFKEAYFTINDLRVYGPPGTDQSTNGTSTFGEPWSDRNDGDGRVISWIGAGRVTRSPDRGVLHGMMMVVVVSAMVAVVVVL